MSHDKTHEVSVLYLLPLRLSVGAALLFSGASKISTGGWGAAYAPKLSEFVSANVANAFDFYRPFLESVVLPHDTAFAVLVAWSELLIGIAIFLGLFTRFAAAAGIFVALNYTFAIGLAVWMPGTETLFIWALFTLMVCSAGRAIGVDGILRRGKRIRLFT